MTRWLIASILLCLSLNLSAQAQTVSPPGVPIGGGVVCAYNASLPTLATGTAGWIQCDSSGRLTVITSAGPSNLTPTNCSGTITAGGTPQAAIAAYTTIHGFTLANIDATSGSGEPLWFSLTGTAAAATSGSYPLSAPTATSYNGLATYTTPFGFGSNHALSVVAATTSHAFSCTYW